jgi:peroxiredoxin Q/BCP
VALCSALFGLFETVVGIPLSLFAGSSPTAQSKAPDFTLRSQDGRRVSLRDFRGKWVVLYFYPKDFTSGCTIEAHNFQRDLEHYRRRNAVILGVSLDTVESHRDFCTKEGLNFKLLSDADHRVSQAYGALADLGVAKFDVRNTFLISPDGKIARIFENVDAYRHTEEVLAALSQLTNDKQRIRKLAGTKPRVSTPKHRRTPASRRTPRSASRRSSKA